MKKFGLILLTFLLVLCNSSNESTEVVDTTTTLINEGNSNDEGDVTTTTPTDDSADTSIVENYEYDKEKMSPFTGLQLSPELWLKRPRRVIAFKVDNNLNARPQSGLQEADTVMEILVEGGMTRFLAFYLDRTSSYVGPIRSARPTDPNLVRPYGGILVVSGATAGLIPAIRDLGVPVLEEVSAPTMFRIGNRKAPHNLYADTELVREYIDKKGFLFNQDVNPLYNFGNDQSNWTPGAGRVTIKYSDFTTVIWKLDKDQYSRFIVDGYSPEEDAVAHNFITRDGYTDILKAPTVVVIQGPLYNDEVTTLPSVLTVGVGPVTIFSGGRYIEGTWRRNDITDPFEFLDDNQDQIEVPPSKQWIHILPLNGEINITDN
ncbi:DUF3048 domain-containing protein [Acidimicrobiaceae bacterium]|nr:DUF3048 domain-containing protein [Acidimicrobiaceae bacterium]